MLYRLVLLLLIQFTFSSVSEVQAAAGKSSAKSEQGKKNKTISKKSAIEIAKSEVRGKVLSAKLIKSRGPAVYRIKMLVGESRVRTVFVDGITGRVIRIN